MLLLLLIGLAADVDDGEEEVEPHPAFYACKSPPGFGSRLLPADPVRLHLLIWG